MTISFFHWFFKFKKLFKCITTVTVELGVQQSLNHLSINQEKNELQP